LVWFPTGGKDHGRSSLVSRVKDLSLGVLRPSPERPPPMPRRQDRSALSRTALAPFDLLRTCSAVVPFPLPVVPWHQTVSSLNFVRRARSLLITVQVSFSAPGLGGFRGFLPSKHGCSLVACSLLFLSTSLRLLFFPTGPRIGPSGPHSGLLFPRRRVLDPRHLTFVRFSVSLDPRVLLCLFFCARLMRFRPGFCLFSIAWFLCPFLRLFFLSSVPSFGAGADAPVFDLPCASCFFASLHFLFFSADFLTLFFEILFGARYLTFTGSCPLCFSPVGPSGWFPSFCMLIW